MSNIHNMVQDTLNWLKGNVTAVRLSKHEESLNAINAFSAFLNKKDPEQGILHLEKSESPTTQFGHHSFTSKGVFSPTGKWDESLRDPMESALHDISMAPITHVLHLKTEPPTEKNISDLNRGDEVPGHQGSRYIGTDKHGYHSVWYPSHGEELYKSMVESFDKFNPGMAKISDKKNKSGGVVTWDKIPDIHKSIQNVESKALKTQGNLPMFKSTHFGGQNYSLQSHPTKYIGVKNVQDLHSDLKELKKINSGHYDTIPKDFGKVKSNNWYDKTDEESKA